MEPSFARQELEIRFAKARAADAQLRALGLHDNECRRLADHLETLLADRGRATPAR